LFAEGGDGRSAWGRRWRDLILSHANDLGGIELLSEAQISICRRVSAMECTAAQGIFLKSTSGGTWERS
jgi:hypothetical protein